MPFVDTIIQVVKADPLASHGIGLYVGCGNGRNYIPLLDAGLDLFGLDVSEEALKQLAERRPTLPTQRLLCGDFRSFQSPVAKFDYLIAIQVFQHGCESDVAAYLQRCAALLRPGGFLFLRVNSASTEVYHAHTVVERSALGGFTVRYDSGPKCGLLVHFYSSSELIQRLSEAFTRLHEPTEIVTARSLPKSGAWAQWEAIWKRRHETTG